MKYLQVPKNTNFVGRKTEIARLERLQKTDEAKILVFYGRRRVGKTELIEQFFAKKKILKFEGLQPDFENPLSKRKEFERQMANCLRMLAHYRSDSAYSKLLLTSWSEFFEILSPLISEEDVILYFEELQWLANYSADFLAELKIFWDNRWRHIDGLNIVFCGSSPAFVVGEFMSNKALYGRSVHLFHIHPFDLHETASFMKVGFKEALTAQLTIGGVVEYLKIFGSYPSFFTGLVEESFTPHGAFVTEIDKIFVSNMRGHPAYRSVIEQLSHKRYLNRSELMTRTGASSGGTFSRILGDLELCGFIDRYSPIHLHGSTKTFKSSLTRYTLGDFYLKYYHTFIAPKLQSILKKQYEASPARALNQRQYEIMLGLNFEVWCRNNSLLIAKHLGFDRIEFQSGSLFFRESLPQFQIDLMFIRADHRIIVTEIKFGSENVDRQVVTKLRQNINEIIKRLPQYKNYTFESALICPESSPNTERLRSEIDHVVYVDQLGE